MAALSPRAAALEIEDLVVRLDARRVIDGFSLRVEEGEVVGLIGASGSGKTVLLRTVLGLLPRASGRIEVMGVELGGASDTNARLVGAKSGVLFQQGALFSSLTVRETVEFPMREYLSGSPRLFRDVAMAKLHMVGLSPEDAGKLPAQLSGGMTKRAALARALALDPRLLLLDEPTSGLDPIAAGEFDALIRALHQSLGLTVLMITHDVDCLKFVCERIVALHDGRAIADGPLAAMLESDDAWLRAYFRSSRDDVRPQEV